jgi:two-component sensor histidine kinase
MAASSGRTGWLLILAALLALPVTARGVAAPPPRPDAGAARALPWAAAPGERKDLSIALLEGRNVNLALESRNRMLIAAGATGGMILLALAVVALARANRAGRRLAAMSARAALQQETLLREMRHRAKNNLQLILSLLNGQVRRQRALAEAAPSDAAIVAAELVHDLRNRIDAMSHVHHMLYEREDEAAPVHARPFLCDLAGAIEASYAADERPVLTLDVADIALPADAALSIGLLAAELVSNLYKHAGAAQARLWLDLAAGELVLGVEDDGRGMPPEGCGEPGGSGLGLIDDLASQLGGVARCVSDDEGTRWTVVVPSPRPRG